MRKSEDKKQIAKQIGSAADLYRQKLVGKRFLYVFDGRYIEVIYKAENFRHLTGVATNLSAKRFYSYAARKILSASDFWFNSVHPYDLCVRKVQHIQEVANMAESECFMLEEIKTDTMSYKFGTTDLKFSLCMNREQDDEGNVKGDCYVVQSLRDEDCFSKSKDAYTVTCIISRPNDAKEYSELLYLDTSCDQKGLPDAVKAMLSEELLTEIEKKSI